MGRSEDCNPGDESCNPDDSGISAFLYIIIIPMACLIYCNFFCLEPDEDDGSIIDQRRIDNPIVVDDDAFDHRNLRKETPPRVEMQEMRDEDALKETAVYSGLDQSWQSIGTPQQDVVAAGHGGNQSWQNTEYAAGMTYNEDAPSSSEDSDDVERKTFEQYLANLRRIDFFKDRDGGDLTADEYDRKLRIANERYTQEYGHGVVR